MDSYNRQYRSLSTDSVRPLLFLHVLLSTDRGSRQPDAQHTTAITYRRYRNQPANRTARMVFPGPSTCGTGRPAGGGAAKATTTYVQ